MDPKIRNVAVCYPQVPFSTGGAELLGLELCRVLRERGLGAEPVSVPLQWVPKASALRSALAWRLLDLRQSNGRPIDLVIATKFPSYVIPHERKVTWLVHQFRQVYELRGTPYSDFGEEEGDEEITESVRRLDRVALGESRRFAISRRVAERLLHYNGLSAEPLHPPPRGRERFHEGEQGDYVLCVGRLESSKRPEALVEALPHTDPHLRAVLVGSGPEAEALRRRAAALGVEERLELRPAVDFEELVRLYADCLAVFFAPFDEDYGFVTVEAFLSGKPVVTAPDAGGPLELVEDGVTGVVTGLAPEVLGARLTELHARRSRARELGKNGAERAAAIRWDAVLERLLEP